MAGSRPKHPLPDGNLFTGDIDRELRTLFREDNPYHAGAEVWKRVGLRGLKLLSEGVEPRDDPYVMQVMDWLVAHQDPETGFWFPKGDRMNGMNGLLKMRYGTFDVCGMDISRTETILSTILSIPGEDGDRFGPACADWNGAGLLAKIGRRHPAFRDRILEVYRRLLPVLAAKRDPVRGGFAWEPGQEDAATLGSTYINVMALSAVRAFILKDNAGIDRLFYMNALRRKLLNSPHRTMKTVPPANEDS
jgi:hypothetical protein